jgi:hypothetical protein
MAYNTGDPMKNPVKPANAGLLDRLRADPIAGRDFIHQRPRQAGGSIMTRVLQGTVHGRTIALEDDLGLAEGQVVELTIRTIVPPTGRQPGEGFLRTEGALADDPHWDAIMEEVYQERKNESRKEFPG